MVVTALKIAASSGECGFKSMHPRFIIHRSWAESRTTISRAIRPDGKRSSTDSLGALLGGPLLEEWLTRDPIDIALSTIGRPAMPRSAPSATAA
jgi:hypothetical protein